MTDPASEKLIDDLRIDETHYRPASSLEVAALIMLIRQLKERADDLSFELGDFGARIGQWVRGDNPDELATNVKKAMLEKNAEIERLKKINSNLMGDDENVPRYTTKRLHAAIDRAVEDKDIEIEELKADIARYVARETEWVNEIERLRDAIKPFVKKDLSQITPDDLSAALVAYRGW